MLTSPKVRDVPVHHEVTETVACTIQDLPAKLGRVYGEIENWAAKNRVHVTAPFARYTMFTPSSCTVEAGFIVDQPVESRDDNIRVQDGGGYIALAAKHHGPFSTIGQSYAALEEFMRIHGYVSAGAPVEYYLTGPDVAPEKQEAEIVWPVVPNEA